MAVDHERRIDRIERIIEIYDERFAEGSKTMATHELRLAGLEDYQNKQNGHLRRIEDKFDEHCKWLNRWMYGIGVGVVMILLALIANLIQ